MKRLFQLVALLSAFAVMAQQGVPPNAYGPINSAGQNSYTVSSGIGFPPLPAAASLQLGTVVQVVDSTTGCSVGGGTAIVLCRDNGTSWVLIGGGGGGGAGNPATPGAANQYANSGATAFSTATCAGTPQGVDSITSPTSWINPCILKQQADAVFTGLRPYVDSQGYGVFSSGNGTITGTTSAPNSTTITTTGLSDFTQVKMGVVIPKAGAATSQSTPAAPSVIAVNAFGSATHSYECKGSDSLEGLTTESPATSITNAPTVWGAAPIVISSISRNTGTSTVTANLSSSIGLPNSTQFHLFASGIPIGTLNFNGLWYATVVSSTQLTWTQAGATETGSPNAGSTVHARNANIVSSISRAPNGTISLVTDTTPTFAIGSQVATFGITPQDLNGLYIVSNVSGTSVTLTQTSFQVAATENGSNATSGGYSYNGGNTLMGIMTWEEDVIVCPALSGTTVRYAVYGNYGAGYALVGSTPWGSNVLRNPGPFLAAGYVPPPAANIPSTPTGATQLQEYVGQITNIVGSTLTVSPAVPQQVTSVSLYHDNSIALNAAFMAANGMPVQTGPGNYFVFNAPTIVDNGFHSGQYTWMRSGGVIANEPIEPIGQSFATDSLFAGGASGIGGFDNNEPFLGYGNPMIYVPPTASTALHIKHTAIQPSGAMQTGLFYQGPTGDVSDSRFLNSYASTFGMSIDMANNFGFTMTNVRWDGTVQYPNNGAGAPQLGYPNFQPPSLGMFFLSNVSLKSSGRNYGVAQGFVYATQEVTNLLPTKVDIEDTVTFQSPWQPILTLLAATGPASVILKNNIMDSNWMPVGANLGCATYCNSLTLDANLTTNAVSDWTGPALTAASAETALDPPGFSTFAVPGIGNAASAQTAQTESSLSQSSANAYAGTCSMVTATTCTFTLATGVSFASTPICIASDQSTPIVGKCSRSGTTVTITAASSNSDLWGATFVGNPN